MKIRLRACCAAWANRSRTHAAPTPTYLHATRVIGAEEGDTSFPSHRAGQQRFASAQGANKQDALGQVRPQAPIQLWGLQKRHHFLQFRLGLVNPGDI